MNKEDFIPVFFVGCLAVVIIAVIIGCCLSDRLNAQAPVVESCSCACVKHPATMKPPFRGAD